MIGKKALFVAAAVVVAGAVSSVQATPITVAPVSALDPLLTLATTSTGVTTEVMDSWSNTHTGYLTHGTPVTFTTAKTDFAAAFANKTGGVLDFESGNGFTGNFGAGATDAVTVSFDGGATNALKLYRTDTVGASMNPTSNFAYASGTQVLGFGTNQNPTLTFDRPVSEFGITAVARNSYRKVTLTYNLVNLSNSSDTLTDTTSTDATNNTNSIFFGYQAPSGYGITSVAVASPDGYVRFDDLGFVSVPEPTSLALLGAWALLGLRRRRAHA